MIVRLVRKVDSHIHFFLQVFGWDEAIQKNRWFTMPVVDMADLPMEEQLQASLDVIEQTRKQNERLASIHSQEKSSNGRG